MSTTTIAVTALVFSCLIYCIISAVLAGRVKTIRDFFHTRDSNGGLIALLLGNLTLGTGLIYNSTLASRAGIFSLAVPLGVITGYYILFKISSALKLGEKEGFIATLKLNRKKIPIFFRFFIFAILMTYTFLISYELFISSELITQLIAPGGGSFLSKGVAIILLTIALFYTVQGGVRGLILTDKVQFGLVFVMLALIFLFSLKPMVVGLSFNSNVVKPTINLIPNDFGFSTIIVSIAAFLTAFTTQLYNVENSKIGTNYSVSDKRWVFIGAGSAISVGLLAFIATGLVIPDYGVDSKQPIFSLLITIAGINSLSAAMTVFLLILGMIAMLLSTLDTALIAMGQTIFDDVLMKDSFDDTNPRMILSGRIVVLFMGTLAIVPCIFMYTYAPLLVPALLCSVHGLTIVSPILVGIVFSLQKKGVSLAQNALASIFVVVYILAVWSFAVYDTYYNRGEMVLTSVLVFLPLSCLWIIFEWFYSRNLKREHLL